MSTRTTARYHEIDFLLPAQRFNIQYSYVTQQGLPFIREYVLRLVHVAPMTKTHIMTYLGLSGREVGEAVSDLIERDELQLTSHGRLTLTTKSQDYFNEMGESPQLSVVFDSGATLTFELAGYSCIGNGPSFDKWRNGISLQVESSQVSQSEVLAEKHFHLRFHEILEKGYLTRALSEGARKPSVYTVNSVNRLGKLPIRLPTEFSIDLDGTPVERDDFEGLSDSEAVHNLITTALSKGQKANNTHNIAMAMSIIGDDETFTLLNESTVDVTLFLHKRVQEDNGTGKRRTILGPIYSQANWSQFVELLSPLLEARINNEAKEGSDRFIWIAPSDPYWGKSSRCADSISDIVSKAKTKQKRLFTPVIFVPMHGVDDSRTRNYWARELAVAVPHLRGLREGFLEGDVEVLYLENEIVVVSYHISKPDSLPVSLPIGFISTDKTVIAGVSRLVKDYVEGKAAFDRPNDLGPVALK